jgi:NADPH-dependent curcumin reductase CurA
MPPLHSREVRLVRRPAGPPEPEDFSLVETGVREPSDGEIVVRNTLMSLDPYMRGRMNDVKSYVPPFVLGEAMTGGAVGVVVESRDARFAPGAYVSHMLGWRDFAVLHAAEADPIDTSLAPAGAYLGVLGWPGLTAYVGLFDVGSFKDGETVFVSAALGAVGSVVGQLVKLHGGRAVGSAGSAEKVAYLRDELGFDAAFDYHGGGTYKKLREAAPGGIDVYFDNVGGEQLEASIGALHTYGRIVACGMISQYNAAQPGPHNLALIVGKRLRMQGFIVFDHTQRRAAFVSEVAPALHDGKIKRVETIVDGLENAVTALLEMLRGGASHIGKLLVRISNDEGAS